MFYVLFRPPPLLCTFLNLKGNRATPPLAVGDALSVTGVRHVITSGSGGSLYFCRRAHCRGVGASAARGKCSRLLSLKRRFPPLVPHRLRTTESVFPELA